MSLMTPGLASVFLYSRGPSRFLSWSLVRYVSACGGHFSDRLWRIFRAFL